MGDEVRLGQQSALHRLSSRGFGIAPESGSAPVPPERYEVEGPLGAGAMGEVFLVKDRDLRRHVAMKMLRGTPEEEDERRIHFIAEAQATSQLEHPGVPPVHEFGITDDGRVYFTMKVLRGRTLQEILDALARGDEEAAAEFTLHRLVTVLERVAETLHFTHERGVLHR